MRAFAHLLTTLVLLACRSERPSSTTPWLLLNEDFRSRISIDTSKLDVVGDSSVVHLRYEFTEALPLPGGKGEYHAVQTLESPECSDETARVRQASLFDSAGVRILEISSEMVDSLPPQRMIGVGGPPLCRFLRAKGMVR